MPTSVTYRDRTIHQKLRLIIMATVGVALMLAKLSPIPAPKRTRDVGFALFGAATGAAGARVTER